MRKKIEKSQPTLLSQIIGVPLNEATSKLGFPSHELISKWSSIVGSTFSKLCVPIKIKWQNASIKKIDIHARDNQSAVLYVRAIPGAAIELQHRKTMLIDRVNHYFGWSCLSGLIIQQGYKTIDLPKKTFSPSSQQEEVLQTMKKELILKPSNTSNNL